VLMGGGREAEEETARQTATNERRCAGIVINDSSAQRAACRIIYIFSTSRAGEPGTLTTVFQNMCHGVRRLRLSSGRAAARLSASSTRKSTWRPRTNADVHFPSW
jgi:hypothetical protein